jgi:hypothetical protein
MIERHTQEPKQRASSETHLVSPSLQRTKTPLTDISSLEDDGGKFSLLPAGCICGADSLGTNTDAYASQSMGSYIRTKEDSMKKLAIGLLAGAGTLLAGGANASDFYARSDYASPGLVQQVRLICNEDGQCYRTRGGRRIIVEDSYNYAPRERYIERRDYRDWDDRAGVGIRAPGVSVGVGVGGDRW